MTALTTFALLFGGLGGVATLFLVGRDLVERALESNRPRMYYRAALEKWNLGPVLVRVVPKWDPAGQQDTAAVVTAQIWNGGRAAISKEMFEHPLELSMGHNDFEIVGCEVVDRVPEMLPVNVSYEKQRVTISPLLLNRGEGFALRVVLLGHSWQMPSEDDIKPIARVRALKGPERVVVQTPREIPLAFGTLLLLSWAIWGYGLEFSASKAPCLKPSDAPFVGLLLLMTQVTLVIMVFYWVDKRRKARVSSPLDVPKYRR